MAYAAGKLRHRVRIERFADNVDSHGDVIQDPNTGEVSRSWQEVDTVWAAIEPLSAREFIQSAAGQSEITARLVIRFRSDVVATDRLVHMVNGVAGAIYNPAAFLRDKETGLEYMTMPCSEGVNDGE